MTGSNCIFYIINVDSFFLSHRLPLALSAQKSGYSVFILTKDTGRRKEIENHGFRFIPVPFERSGTNPFKDFFIIVQLYRLIRKYKPALIHNVTIKPSIYGSIAARFAHNNTRVINAISGLGYNFIEGRNGIVQRVLKRLISYAFKSDITFIFQNRDDRDLYNNMGLLKNNDYRIIKGSGVDSSLFALHDPVSKQLLKITITSRLLYDKGIMEFIGAACLLRKKWEGKAKFIIAGEIDFGNRACIPEKDLREKLIPGYLVWLGYQEDVKPLLIQSDIVCLPSYREGLPKSLVEAMAIGRPIVTTDVPGCRECVDNGKNGFLVPPKDSKGLASAIEILLKDENMRLKMGRASREKMEKELSLKQVVSETMELYKEVLSVNKTHLGK